MIKKMYAELTGNYKNYRIKSLQDNKLMCELADEELQGSVPKAIKEEAQQQQDIGYYYDENGYKRFGIIPNKSMQFPSGTSFNTDSGYFMRSSDPRYYGRT